MAINRSRAVICHHRGVASAGSSAAMGGDNNGGLDENRQALSRRHFANIRCSVSSSSAGSFAAVVDELVTCVSMDGVANAALTDRDRDDPGHSKARSHFSHIKHFFSPPITTPRVLVLNQLFSAGASGQCDPVTSLLNLATIPRTCSSALPARADIPPDSQSLAISQACSSFSALSGHSRG